MTNDPRRPSRHLNLEDAIAIWPRLWRKEFSNRIAADYDVNPGRIAEIKKKQRFPEAEDLARGLNPKQPSQASLL